MSDDDARAGSGRTSAIASQIIMTASITVGLAVLAAFWALSDPRAEIRAIKTDYLSVREHNEFRDRVRQDIERVEADNQRQISRAEVEQVWRARRAELDVVHRQIEELMRVQHEHERDDRLLYPVKPLPAPAPAQNGR